MATLATKFLRTRARHYSSLFTLQLLGQPRAAPGRGLEPRAPPQVAGFRRTSHEIVDGQRSRHPAIVQCPCASNA